MKFQKVDINTFNSKDIRRGTDLIVREEGRPGTESIVMDVFEAKQIMKHFKCPEVGLIYHGLG
jgi:hypothetical protein